MQILIIVHLYDTSALEIHKSIIHKSINKIENMQKRALRFLLIDYSSDYETLLKKTNKCTMEVKRLRLLALEIFKSFNENCPTFIKDYFEKNENSVSKKYNLKIPIRNSATFGENSLRSIAPRVWNSLPEQLKTETSYVNLKKKWINGLVPSVNAVYVPI